MGKTKNSESRVECRTPTPGKQPTRIDRWKYDAVRSAILEALPREEPGVAFADLPGLVRRKLETARLEKGADLLEKGVDQLEKLGSVSWYTTTVKLDLEVRGEIARIVGAKPQRLVLTK